VSPKASHDYAEVFDGVPSQHDGKDAACVAELSALNKSAQWRWDSSSRELRNETDWMDAQQQSLTRWLARLEALLGRFWPEACELLDLSSATLLKLLEHYGSVAGLAADPEARVRLRRWGGSKLKGEKIEELLASAAKTMGVRALPADVSQMQRYAQAALLARREVRLSKLRLLDLTKENEVIERQGIAVGHVTAAVLWAHLGDPRDYHCAEAYRKAMGLNLKERSSGRWQGHLKISKRGPGQVRRWLYFAALRCCQEPWIEGWYETKKNQGEGHAKRALVALMRKLALALYCVGAKASPYDIRTLLPEADRYKAKKKHLERMKR
jgi:transposase